MPTITTKDGTTNYLKDWGAGQPVVFSHGWPTFIDMTFYGHAVSTRGVLKGEVAVPASAQPFLDAVRGAKAQVRA